MTKTLHAHFDGKFLVPEIPIDLPLNERLIIEVRPEEADEPKLGTAAFVYKHIADKAISEENAELMRNAIEDACERINPESPVDFDAADDRHERGD